MKHTADHSSVEKAKAAICVFSERQRSSFQHVPVVFSHWLGLFSCLVFDVADSPPPMFKSEFQNPRCLEVGGLDPKLGDVEAHVTIRGGAHSHCFSGCTLRRALYEAYDSLQCVHWHRFRHEGDAFLIECRHWECGLVGKGS